MPILKQDPFSVTGASVVLCLDVDLLDDRWNLGFRSTAHASCLMMKKFRFATQLLVTEDAGDRVFSRFAYDLDC